MKSVEAYRWSSARRRSERRANPPLDARPVLYGPPLLEFIIKSEVERRENSKPPLTDDAAEQDRIANEIIGMHRAWLMTPREDLRGKSPREVLLERQDFIDFDLHTRSMQWSLLNEGPPCLARDSFAYRFAGFGTHEWVVYYDLVRHLLWEAVTSAHTIEQLDRIKTEWLESSEHYEGRAPANIIENERRRLPEVATATELLIDENCECCRMLAQEAEMGISQTFWHLDGSRMEDEFVFSTCLTLQEWEAENRRREELGLELMRDMEERRQRDREFLDDELKFAQ